MNDNREDEKILAEIILQGVKEVMFARSARPVSYRKIWEDVIGKMFDTLEYGASENWKQLPAELQDKMAEEKIKLSFPDFLEMVAEMENMILEEISPSSVQ
ncbi:MAG: hypothetical protein AAB949_00495 [Patescibacteria group bacterium]